MKTSKQQIGSVLVVLVVLLIINFISATYFQRLDLTENKRYTLSETSKSIAVKAEDPLIVEVYLKGEFPSEFKRLQNETRYLLEEYSAYNPEIKFQFINPLEEGNDASSVANQFYEAGMSPQTLNVFENGKTSESLIFPWAIAYYGDKKVKIDLLKKKLGDNNEEIVNASVQQLEYAFSDGFNKLLQQKSKKVAVMRGNGELPDDNLADFLKTLKNYYFLAPFTLDSVAENPQKTLENLEEFDLIIEAKPTETFTENEKYVLDQYLMKGGKALWLVDNVVAEKDSLFTSPDQKMLAYPRDLNLNDFFFSYGVRISPSLVNDIVSAPIILAQGKGKNTQFNPFPWFYEPLAISDTKNPITQNLEAVKFNFANPIDTLKNGVKKTILLSSSPNTKIAGTPEEINLSIIREKPDPSSYNAGPQPLAVLLEGEFKSVYKNRIKPFSLKAPLDKSKPTKILVISDGDVIKNELQKGKPQALGYDQYTATTYGNKEFLLNSINYLLDDSGLLNLRTKEVKIAFMDTDKVAQERTFWQFINIGVPLLLLGIFGFGFTYFRKRKYVK